MKIALFTLAALVSLVAGGFQVPEELQEPLFFKVSPVIAKLLEYQANTELAKDEINIVEEMELEFCYGRHSLFTEKVKEAFHECIPCDEEADVDRQAVRSGDFGAMVEMMMEYIMSNMEQKVEEIGGVAKAVAVEKDLGDFAPVMANEIEQMVVKLSEVAGVDYNEIQSAKAAILEDMLGKKEKMPSREAMLLMASRLIVTATMDFKKCFLASMDWINDDCSVNYETIMEDVSSTVFGDEAADFIGHCGEKVEAMTQDSINLMLSGQLDDHTVEDIIALKGEQEPATGRRKKDDEVVGVAQLDEETDAMLNEVALQAVKQWVFFDCIQYALKTTCEYTLHDIAEQMLMQNNVMAG